MCMCVLVTNCLLMRLHQQQQQQQKKLSRRHSTEWLHTHTHTQPEDCPFAYPIDSFLVSLHFSSKGVFALLNCCRCCRFCSIWKFCFHLSVALQRTDATTAAAFYANDLSSAEGCSFDFDAAAAAAARKSKKIKSDSLSLQKSPSSGEWNIWGRQAGSLLCLAAHDVDVSCFHCLNINWGKVSKKKVSDSFNLFFFFLSTLLFFLLCVPFFLC